MRYQAPLEGTQWARSEIFSFRDQWNDNMQHLVLVCLHTWLELTSFPRQYVNIRAVGSFARCEVTRVLVEVANPFLWYDPHQYRARSLSASRSALRDDCAFSGESRRHRDYDCGKVHAANVTNT